MNGNDGPQTGRDVPSEYHQLVIVEVAHCIDVHDADYPPTVAIRVT